MYIYQLFLKIGRDAFLSNIVQKYISINFYQKLYMCVYVCVYM